MESIGKLVFIFLIGTLLLLGATIVIHDTFTSPTGKTYTECSPAPNVDLYGKPVSNYNQTTNITGQITYIGNNTFTLYISNPEKKVVTIGSHPSIQPVTNSRIPVSVTKENITYQYRISSSAGVQEQIFTEFNESGYFPIPPVSPNVTVSITNGEQLLPLLGTYNADKTVRTYTNGCHTVVYISETNLRNWVAFNELRESEMYLPYSSPYSSVFLFTVRYDVQLDSMEGVVGVAQQNTGFIENGRVHQGMQNVVYHEYIHTRQASATTINRNSGFIEAITSYNGIQTRTQSNQVSMYMNQAIYFLFSKENTQTAFTEEAAYSSGVSKLHRGEQKYNVNITKAEKQCMDTYTKQCLLTAVGNQNTSAKQYFKENTDSQTRTNSIPKLLIGLIQLTYYISVIYLLKFPIYTLLIAFSGCVMYWKRV